LNVSGLAIQDPRFTAGEFATVATGKELMLVYKPANL